MRKTDDVISAPVFTSKAGSVAGHLGADNELWIMYFWEILPIRTGPDTYNPRQPPRGNRAADRFSRRNSEKRSGTPIADGAAIDMREVRP